MWDENGWIFSKQKINSTWSNKFGIFIVQFIFGQSTKYTVLAQPYNLLQRWRWTPYILLIIFCSFFKTPLILIPLCDLTKFNLKKLIAKKYTTMTMPLSLLHLISNILYKHVERCNKKNKESGFASFSTLKFKSKEKPVKKWTNRPLHKPKKREFVSTMQ